MFIKGNRIKINEISREDGKKVNLVPVELYIRGISFPTNKQALCIEARINNAPENIMNTLKQFQETQYQSVIDVSKELERIS
mgnify:CR=1 FL=1